MTTKNTKASLTSTLTALHKLGYPRGFTLNEIEIYNEAAATHNLDELTRQLGLETTATDLENRNARIESIQAGIKALQKQLEAEYEKPDWDYDRIESIITRLEQQTAAERDHIIENAPGIVERHQQREESWAELLRVQDRVYVDAVLNIAKQHGISAPAADEALRNASADDLIATAELVEAGLESRPLNRAERRAAAKRRHGRDKLVN